VIIGGGVAGLSAAVELSSRGKKILLLEQRQYLGGRTYSFRDKTTGDVIDNGQHLLMGCYAETRRYLRQIGSEHLADLQPSLHIDFLHPRLGLSSLHTSRLPVPLHALIGLFGLKSLSFSDRLWLARVGAELLIPESVQRNRLAQLTVDEWLKRLGQSEIARKYLWDIIAIGSLNDNPSVVSALLFYRVLKAAFTGRRDNASLLMPRVGLSELLVQPAEAFILEHSGEIRLGTEVRGLDINGSAEVAVTTNDGERVKTHSVISAVPWFVAQTLLAKTGINISRAFRSSPIISIYLWLDRVVTDLPLAALLDTRLQWMFNRTLLQGKSNDSRFAQSLCFVISGAEEFVEMSADELVRIAMEDLRALVPQAGDARVLHSVVLKEKRATFSPTPRTERLRPAAQTAMPNVFLAGDWTDIGFPATIEGAIFSGRRAAEHAIGVLSNR
jgi:squalene-associated FAD-dependent desaturase